MKLKGKNAASYLGMRTRVASRQQKSVEASHLFSLVFMGIRA